MLKNAQELGGKYIIEKVRKDLQEVYGVTELPQYLHQALQQLHDPLPSEDQVRVNKLEKWVRELDKLEKEKVGILSKKIITPDDIANLVSIRRQIAETPLNKQPGWEKELEMLRRHNIDAGHYNTLQRILKPVDHKVKEISRQNGEYLSVPLALAATRIIQLGAHQPPKHSKNW